MVYRLQNLLQVTMMITSIKVLLKKDSDEQEFSTIRGNFFNHLLTAFNSVSTGYFLVVCSCLNHKMWPKDPLERALYGEKCVAELCKDSFADSAKTVMDYAIFKQSDGVVIGEHLQD